MSHVRSYHQPMPATSADRRLQAAARRWTGDLRSAAQLREHYAIERRLAQRLREASAEERPALYAHVYDELFSSIPHHPQLRRRDSLERARQVDRELHFLLPLLAGERPMRERPMRGLPMREPAMRGLPTRGLPMRELRLLEVGAGDLALSRRLAAMVGEVHAVDVASALAGVESPAANLHIYLTDGRRLPLAESSIDLAYSNQLLEHLHPADAALHLREVHRVLAPGGRYLCVTPNALTGPWDISRMFSAEPTGLHLREYSNRQLLALLRQANFAQVQALVPAPAPRAARIVPAWVFTAPELALAGLPPPLRRLALAGPWRKPLNSVRLLARKPAPRQTPQ
jgi:SAM-dependent methyltransferase